jgi:O-acetyl-ADP-ribose deacetylase (regulator of RNase III)
MLSWLKKLCSSPSPRPPVTFAVVLGDITRCATDAIVNAADCTLQGGTGVDGAIRQAAGPELSNACAAIGRAITGGAVITPGFYLPARHVIHAVAPVFDGHGNNVDLLESAYLESIRLADRQRLTAVAFPLLGAGAFSWPEDLAAEAAARALKTATRSPGTVTAITMVAFTTTAFKHLERYFGVRGQRLDGSASRRYHSGAI